MMRNNYDDRVKWKKDCLRWVVKKRPRQRTSAGSGGSTAARAQLERSKAKSWSAEQRCCGPAGQSSGGCGGQSRPRATTPFRSAGLEIRARARLGDRTRATLLGVATRSRLSARPIAPTIWSCLPRHRMSPTQLRPKHRLPSHRQTSRFGSRWCSGRSEPVQRWS